MMSFMAAGMPIPPEIIVEASDVPRKAEIQAALKKQGMGPPNPELAKALGAQQGQAASQPDGVNR